jgi:hypothetical protein
MPADTFGYRADDAHPLGVRLLREAAAFAFFVVLTIVLTWPLASQLNTTVSDLGDPLLNTWILDWDLYSFTNAPSRLYDANIFYPCLYPLAYSENLFGIAIVALPFYLLGFTPLAVYNIAFLLGFAFCGYAAFVLGRTLTRSIAAGLIAGIFYAFVNFRLDHLAHIQLIWGGWMPLMLAALLHYWRRPTIRNAVLYGACGLMNALCNVHLFLFGTTTLLLSIALLAVISTRFKWRTLIGAAAATMLAAALMVPVLLPYKKVSELYNMVRDESTARAGSAIWTDWLSSTGVSRTYGGIAKRENVRGEAVLFPGLMVLFLTASALLMDRRKLPVALDARGAPRWLLRLLDVLIVVMAMGTYFGAAAERWQWRVFGHMIISLRSSDLPATILIVAIVARLALQLPRGFAGELQQSLRTAAARSRVPIELWVLMLWIVVGVIGSLGMNTFFHTFLYERISMFRSMRVPARWASVAYVGLAGAAACGTAAWIDSRRTKIARWGVATLLVALMVHDILPVFRWEHALEENDASYRWLRDSHVGGGTLELPVNEGIAQYLYQFGATIHHKPLMNGTSGFEPPLHARIREMTSDRHFDPRLLDLLTRNNCRLILVHDDWLRGASEPAHEWLTRELTAHHLGFIRRFDHRGGGDYLFAVTQNVPDWETLRPPETRDAAGFTDDQELQRALRAQATYMNRTFGVVDSPRSDETIAGRAMTVKGWALSPNGIAAVDVLLHNGKYRFRATPVSRIDVQMKFPWYPRVHNAGFTYTFAKRPKGVPKFTDVQVEVIDGHGGRTRFPDCVIVW